MWLLRNKGAGCMDVLTAIVTEFVEGVGKLLARALNKKYSEIVNLVIGFLLIAVLLLIFGIVMKVILQ